MNKWDIRDTYERYYEHHDRLKYFYLKPYYKYTELAAHWVKTGHPFAEIVKLATGRQLNTDDELETLFVTALSLRWFEIEGEGKTSKFVIPEVKE